MTLSDDVLFDDIVGYKQCDRHGNMYEFIPLLYDIRNKFEQILNIIDLFEDELKRRNRANHTIIFPEISEMDREFIKCHIELYKTNINNELYEWITNRSPIDILTIGSIVSESANQFADTIIKKLASDISMVDSYSTKRGYSYFDCDHFANDAGSSAKHIITILNKCNDTNVICRIFSVMNGWRDAIREILSSDYVNNAIRESINNVDIDSSALLVETDSSKFSILIATITLVAYIFFDIHKTIPMGIGIVFATIQYNCKYNKKLWLRNGKKYRKLKCFIYSSMRKYLSIC